MKRLTFLLLGGILVSSAARAGQQTGYWQQRFRYTMQVQLHPEDHRVVAHSSIVYVNQSPDTLDRIYLHLYPRAFNPKSVKYREFLHALGRQGRAAGFMKNPEPYEWDLQIQDFSATTSDGSATQSYELDDTIFRTLLPVPLVPGDSVRLELDWTLKVGRMFERAGEIDGQYNMAQWYPKLVVYDQTGWHPDVFHAEGEFYGEYGDFDVTLDVPNNYIIGATGVVTEGDPGWEAVRVDTSMDFSDWLEQAQFPEPDSSRRRVVRFRARQVHDFAWVASPDYVYESGEWNGIQVHVLYNKSHPQWSKVVVQRAEEALRWLSTQFGLYPWPQMTVTDRLRGGGMEYPMLVMNGRESEGLIVHEIGHNWFYGILGNNEVDQAWLDEGFTTFQTRWHALTEYPGGNAPRPWLKPYQQKFWKFTSYYDNDQWRAIRAVTSGFDEPVQRKSYLYKSGANYGVNAYTKPSLMLHELKAILGEPVFLSAMQHYFHLWELKHVDEYRFRQAIEEAAGRELDWFFDPWLHDTRYTDFQLKSLRSTPNPDGTWHTVVKVTQRGDRLLPPVVDLVFRDGSTQRLAEPDFLWRWDYTLEADSPQKPVKAIVDPDNDFLDVDRRNNYSGAMPREILFNWPGMSYRPRSARVIKWLPALQYQEQDQWLPGLALTREYGPWESTQLQVVASPSSGRIFYDFSAWRRPVRSPWKNRYLSVHSFDFGGAEGVRIQTSRQFSRGYGQGPYRTVRTGFYTVNAKDTTRTDLFDPGRSTVLYTQHAWQAGSWSWVVDVQGAPAGWSDWSFARVAVTAKYARQVGPVEWKNRWFAGKLWSDQNLPVQERFGIEGNGSYDLYQHSYTRDASSLFGVNGLRDHYQLEGDGNLRGFVGRYAGSEALAAWNTALSGSKTILGVDWTGSFFADAGLVTGSKDRVGDDGFHSDVLADLGVGLELEKTLLGFPLYLRLDSPFLTLTPDGTNTDFQRWVFSFQRAF